MVGNHLVIRTIPVRFYFDSKTTLLPRTLDRGPMGGQVKDGTSQDFLDPTRLVNFKIYAGWPAGHSVFRFLISKKKKSLPKSEAFVWPKSQIFRPKAGDLQKKKRSSPKSEAFFRPESQIYRPKACNLKKKRSSPKSEAFFWPKSQIFRPKADDLQKKGLRRNPKPFSGRNCKFTDQKHQLKKIPWGARKKSGGQKRKRPCSGRKSQKKRKNFFCFLQK